MSSLAKNPPAAHVMACISDIHGNLAALEAVLEEIERHGAKKIYALGDHVYGGDQPLEVWRALQKASAQCLSGMSDKALCRVPASSLKPTSDHEREMAARFAKTRDALGDLVIEQLRRLPDTLRVPLVDGNEIVMVHGSPSDPTTDMSHDLSDEELSALLGDDPADIVVCGASHLPFVRDVGGVRIVNVGTVGAAPSNERVAHFTIVSPAMGGTEIAQHYAEY